MHAPKREVAASFIILLLIASTLYVVVWANGSNSSDVIVSQFPLSITVKTPRNAPEAFFKAFIFRAYVEETRLVETVVGAEIATVRLTVEWVPHSFYDPETGERKRVYQTINYDIIVFGMEGRGAVTVPIDPAEGNKEVTIAEEPYSGGGTLSQDEVLQVYDGIEETDYTWEWTHIVTYHSWYNIDVKFKANIGTKVAVTTKHRLSEGNDPAGPPEVIHEWVEAGRAVVTLDSGIEDTDWRSGIQRHETWFYLYYKYERWIFHMPAGDYEWNWLEIVEVVDTNKDPWLSQYRYGSPLDGNGVSDPWNYGNAEDGTYGTGQGQTRTIKIYGHQGEAWRWSVSVGFGVQWPKGVSVSVSLGVWPEKQTDPPTYVFVKVGTHPGGDPNYLGWTYDRGTKWTILYQTWAPPPP